MALDTTSAWTKPAFRVTAAACGAFLGGMLGDIFGKSAADFVASCAEKFGESAAEKLLGPRFDSLANKFKAHSREIEKVYREALRESLVTVHSQVGKEFEDWFENWDACLKSSEPLDLEQVQPGELVSQNLDAILCRTMQRLDAQGQRRKTGNLSLLQGEYRPLPDELAAQIESLLPEHFRESFRSIIVRDEYKQAWKEAQQSFQEWLSATIVHIDAQLTALKQVVDNEFQEVLRVIDASFLEKQREGETTRFLSISRGDWKLVAQRGGIERDLAREVTDRLIQAHSEKAALQIIRGEPGSGKTTLLLQIGAQLVAAGRAVVEVQGGSSLDKFRYFATKLSKSAQGRLYILIDDIYRDEDQAALIVEVLSNLGELLPITIIATTPSFADRTKSIRTSSYLDILDAVSPDNLTDNEIDQLRKMPGVAELSPKRFNELSKTRRILVAMLQLTEGKPIDQILSDTAQHLKKNFPDTYKAWGIVVVFNAYGLHIPSLLLDGILDKPYFSDSLLTTPAKVGSEGIIFPSSSRFKNSWFAGHILIAQFALKVAFADTIRRTFLAAVRTASLSDPEHSVFLGYMLRVLSSGSRSIPAELTLATELFRSNEEKIRNLAISVPEAMEDWAMAFRNLGQRDMAEQCLLSAKPTNPTVAQGVASGLEQLGKAREAIDTAVRWCDSHPDDTYVRTFYLGLVERQGTSKNVKDAIEQTAIWLDRHDDDSSVRTAFLDLVEQKGTPQDVKDAIEQTAIWLDADKHADVISVREFYLGLIERRGTTSEVIGALAMTEEWLAQYNEDTNVRTAYLGIIEHRGTTPDVMKAISKTAEWLAKHDDAAYVRTFYLGLIERCAKHDLDKATDDTVCWLKKHPKATDVWTALIAILVRNGKTDRAIEMTSAAIKDNPKDLNLLERYLDLIASQGSEMEVKKILDELEVRFPNNNAIPLRRARWLAEVGRTDEAGVVFTNLLNKFPNWTGLHHAYGRFFLDLLKWAEARKEFQAVLRLNIKHQMAHEGNAMALRGLAAQEQEAGMFKIAGKYLQMAENHFRSAILWAERQLAPVARFYTSVGWFYLDQDRFAEALSSFDAAIREAPEHFSNYWGKGSTLQRLGRPAEAIVALETALAKAPQPLESPAKEEIPRLLEECRKALEN